MKKNGFTLIELLVTILAIGIICGIIFTVSKIMVDRNIDKKAVELGMAEYVIKNYSTGETEIKWKNSLTNIPKPWLSSTITNDNEVYTINIYKQ